MRRKLLLATNNQGKVREIKTILKGIPFTFISLKKAKKIPNNIIIKETGTTFTENAKLKAKTFGKMAGLLTLAEDSGLKIDALAGKPGVKSARFAKGKAKDRNQKVLHLMKKIPQAKRTASFESVVAIYDPLTNKTSVFAGKTKGSITLQPQGTGGFGYDPIFFSAKLNKSFGLARLREKNKVSHRARALKKAKLFLIKYSQAIR